MEKNTDQWDWGEQMDPIIAPIKNSKPYNSTVSRDIIWALDKKIA